MIYFQRQVIQLMAVKDSEIELLKSENRRLIEERDNERKRAERAIDNLLALKDLGMLSVAEKVEPDEERFEGIMSKIMSAGEGVAENASGQS